MAHGPAGCCSEPRTGRRSPWYRFPGDRRAIQRVTGGRDQGRSDQRGGEEPRPECDPAQAFGHVGRALGPARVDRYSPMGEYIPGGPSAAQSGRQRRSSLASCPAMRFAPYLRLLRENPSFSRLYAAQLISFGGDWFATVALLGLSLELTGSSALAALVLVLQTGGFAITAPIAGNLADRFDRRKLMVAADLAAFRLRSPSSWRAIRERCGSRSWRSRSWPSALRSSSQARRPRCRTWSTRSAAGSERAAGVGVGHDAGGRRRAGRRRGCHPRSRRGVHRQRGLVRALGSFDRGHPATAAEAARGRHR